MTPQVTKARYTVLTPGLTYYTDHETDAQAYAYAEAVRTGKPSLVRDRETGEQWTVYSEE